jgi:hypothetical protein
MFRLSENQTEKVIGLTKQLIWYTVGLFALTGVLVGFGINDIVSSEKKFSRLDQSIANNENTNRLIEKIYNDYKKQIYVDSVKQASEKAIPKENTQNDMKSQIKSSRKN